MLSAVRLRAWILQCFRKKVGRGRSVRGGKNRPSFVELRVYVWLYKRTFFFFLTSKRQYYFIISHRPISKSGQAISTWTGAWLRQRLWRGNPLSKYDMEIPWPQLHRRSTRVWRAKKKKKRQKYLSGNTDEGRCARQKAQPAFSRQKAWLKKKRHAAVGRRGKQGKSKGNETLVRKKQSLKKAGKQVLIHTLWSEGKKAGWPGRAVWKKPFILGHAITWCISWKRLGVQTNANRLIISLDQVRIKQQLPTDL